ncbi:hypothetical protein [Tabrizicola sp.]|uniref:hypothetical protein n=1 Tax=Tabrizicola sp. TaxID=2005166 RepID=UPI003F32A000
MRLWLVTAFSAAFGLPTYADPWHNWYVGIVPDAAHPGTVEKEEAEAAYAGVASEDQNGDRIMFGVRCSVVDPQSDNPKGNERLITSIFIGGVHRDVTQVPIHLLASFDGGAEVEMGPFLFNQFALVGNARPQFLAMLMTHREMKIWAREGTLAATVPLENAAESIAGIQCWGDEIK